jgi:hypothetical protein
MAVTNDIINLPSTKILVDLYNIDTAHFVLVNSEMNADRTRVVADYVHATGDAEYPLTLRVQANFIKTPSGLSAHGLMNPDSGYAGRTNYSVRLSGYMNEVVDGVTTRVSPVTTVIAFEVPSRTIENLTDVARFVSAAYFCLFPATAASAVPVETKLSKLSYGVAAIY